MKADQLIDVLVKNVGARKDGAAYLLPAETDASVFVALEAETLSIARISRIEPGPGDALLTIDTAKGERYIVAFADVRAVKIDRSENHRRGGGAGFGK